VQNKQNKEVKKIAELTYYYRELIPLIQLTTTTTYGSDVSRPLIEKMGS